MKYLVITLLSALLLSACNVRPIDTVADTRPLVAIATINGVNARRADKLMAPAAQMFNPNTEQFVPVDVPVEITASDERGVVDVAATLTQITSPNAPDFEEVWNGSLNTNSTEFRNPFTFNVPFQGPQTGTYLAQLQVVATDTKENQNEPFLAELEVDGSLALLEAVVPEEAQSGKFSLSGTAQDNESGIRSFAAFIDGELLEESDETSVTDTSFSTAIEASDIGNGEHTLTLSAVNGVNVPVTRTFRFTVSINASPVAEDDQEATEVDQAVSIDVLANDTDEDSDPLIISAVTEPANGVAAIIGDALIQYTPNAGFTGTDVFDYTISDGQGGVSSARVTVTVGAAAPEPAPPDPAP